jgi:carboxylesterase
MSPPYFSGFEPLAPQVSTQLMPDAQPRSLNRNTDADAVVICVHGFTGNPYEVDPAVAAIAAPGVSGGCAIAPWSWLSSCDDPETTVCPDHAIGHVGGCPIGNCESAGAVSSGWPVWIFDGGAIALSMAAEGLVDACAVAAPAIRLPRKAEVLIPLLSWAKFYLDAPVKEPFYLPVYQFLHSQALRALWQLARHGRKQLPQIHCPVFAVHSQNDPTVPPVVLSLMQQRIPQAIQTAWFNDSGHVMLRDVSGAQVASAIAHFFSQQFG